MTDAAHETDPSEVLDKMRAAGLNADTMLKLGCNRPWLTRCPHCNTPVMRMLVTHAAICGYCGTELKPLKKPYVERKQAGTS